MLKNQKNGNEIFIGDVVSLPMFEAYDRFLKEIVARKTEALFYKPIESELRPKIAYIKAIKDIINLNEEARNEKR